ncbi:hypothetical protein RJ640_015459 [Escallonia rubra]|uniref:Uncharacterized protein n=1 Tax=Escallonia rubra TaxID=112253 RepID=A0AA88QSQ8_9ASTE|nr:hypothetical protein RJ640_015459 [Escallonia rubra]
MRGGSGSDGNGVSCGKMRLQAVEQKSPTIQDLGPNSNHQVPTNSEGYYNSSSTDSKYQDYSTQGITGRVGIFLSLKSAELGQYRIRVNCISPSGVVTGLSPRHGATLEQMEASQHQLGNLKGNFLRVEDVAKAVLYLASDDGGYVSGHNLVVDGGFSVVNPTILKVVGLIQ